MKTFLAIFAIGVSLIAQDKFEYWPGVSSPEEIVKYMEALAAARPHQMRVVDYAKTWEGRRLVYCVLSSEANIRRLDEIRAGMKQLADPRKTPDADAKRIMARMPAVVW